MLLVLIAEQLGTEAYSESKMLSQMAWKFVSFRMDIARIDV